MSDRDRPAPPIFSEGVMAEFQCPLCSKPFGYFKRKSQETLDIAIAAHIMRHMESAEQRAIDHARMECQHVNCLLGCNKMYCRDVAGFTQKLTDYDHKLLKGIGIKDD